jgi:hypothetical protein
MHTFLPLENRGASYIRSNSVHLHKMEAGNVSLIRDTRNSYKMLVGKICWEQISGETLVCYINFLLVIVLCRTEEHVLRCLL